MPAAGTVVVEASEEVQRTETVAASLDPRRRFTHAALWGVAIAAVPFLWVLWGDGSDPLRTALPSGHGSDFYDIQARALFDGTWAVPKGSLLIEAFVIDGRHYLYFGPFASFLRMPIMAFTDSLDGRMTVPSMLLAWLVTAAFLPALMWRVRVIMRGPVALSRSEAFGVGAFVVAVLGGSVVAYLGALPWIYHEDFSWSIALVLGVLFTLLGVLERPTMRGVVLMGVLVLCAVLNRSATGWACVIAVLLAAAWFARGHGGAANRRWWLPLLGAALVPLAAGCAVTWMKFGTPFGLPMASQVWSKIDQHRRDFLAANGGMYFSPRFIPSTLLAYLRPDGLRLTSIFPFVTLPANPAQPVLGVMLDQTYRTGSLPLSTPLPFLLACWGLITAFRPRPMGRVHLLRIPLLGAAAATVGVLVWGYIAHRYLADFMPIVVLAGVVGLVDVFRRLERRPYLWRRGAVVAAVGLATVGVIVNLAIALPTENLAWGGSKAKSYVRLQETIGELTGRPLARKVVFGDELPPHGPADQLFVLGDCDGLYVSTGEFDRPWVPLELRRVDIDLTVGSVKDAMPRIPVLTIGSGAPYSVVWIEGKADDSIRFRITDNLVGTVGEWQRITPGRHRVRITVDSGRHEASVLLDGREALSGWITAAGHRREANETAAASAPRAPVTIRSRGTNDTPMCRDLAAQARALTR